MTTTTSMLPSQNHEKGPKQCVSCRLGPRWVFFLIYSCFFLYTNDFYRYYLRYTGKNDDNGPKRHISHRLGTRWVFLKIYSCFSIIPHQHHTTLMSPTTYHPNLNGLQHHHTTWRTGAGEGDDRGKGSRRDMSHALDMFFLYCLHLQLGLLLPPSKKTTTTISGPNDAYRVIWALGEFFLKLLFIVF